MTNKTKQRPSVKRRVEGINLQMSTTAGLVQSIMTPLEANRGVAPDLLKEITFILGEGGHARTQLACDMECRAEWEKRFKDRLANSNSLADQAFFKFEYISQAGCTKLTAPLVNSMQVRDEVLKELRLHKLDGVIMTSPCIVRFSTADERWLVTRVRGYANLTGNDDVARETIKNLRIATAALSPLGTSTWRLLPVSYSDLPAVVSWMNVVSENPYEVVEREGKSAMLYRMTDLYSDIEAVRMLAHLSLHRVPETVTGIGSQGKSMVSHTQTKLLSWHRGRRETGTILPETFDPWAFVITIEREIDAECLPMRFDRPMTMLGMSRPPKAPKPTGKLSQADIRKRVHKLHQPVGRLKPRTKVVD